MHAFRNNAMAIGIALLLSASSLMPSTQTTSEKRMELIGVCLVVDSDGFGGQCLLTKLSLR